MDFDRLNCDVFACISSPEGHHEDMQERGHVTLTTLEMKGVHSRTHRHTKDVAMFKFRLYSAKAAAKTSHNDTVQFLLSVWGDTTGTRSVTQ